MKKILFIITMAVFCMSASGFGKFSKKESGLLKSAAASAVSKATKSIEFRTLPTTLEELKAMPEASLNDEYTVAALAVAVLCNYEKDPEETCRMMDFLDGPKEMTNADKQFLKDRLDGRSYVMRSYFKGATPENNYTASTPYTVEVGQNTHSRDEKGYVKLFIQSSGADSPRPITLREKESTEQWFVWKNSLTTDVRKPAADDPWK